jgi:hypothetical protein
MARSSKMSEHHITDAADIETLCRLQQQFVRQWNRLESAGNLNDHSHAVAGGAEYSSGLYLGRRRRKASAGFVLPGEPAAYVCLYAHRGWDAWHKGWSFLRHELTPDQVDKIVVYGSLESFHQWMAAVIGYRPPVA